MNENNSLQFNIEHIACYISLMIATMPIVDYYCNWYVTVVPVLIIGIRLIKSNITLLEALKYLSVVSAVLLLQYFTVYRGQPFLERMINGFIAWLPGLIAIYANYYCDKKFLKSYLQVGTLLLTLTSITTIRGLAVYPNASRELASGTALYDTEIYTRQNIGGFEFIYALVIFIPICIWLIKHTEKVWKIINYICLIIILMCIYESQYTTALIISLVTLMAIILCQGKYLTGVVFMAVVVMLVLSGKNLTSILSNFFEFLSDNIKFEYVSDRLLQVSQVLAGQKVETDTSTERIDFYKTCWESFKENPIFGQNIFGFDSKNISGHSFILDILAGSGLLGISVLIFSLRTAISGIIINGSSFINKYVLIELIVFLCISILNPTGFMVIYIMVFMFGTCIQRIEEKSIKEEAQ